MKKTKAREWELILGMGGYYNGKEVHYAKGPIVDAPLPNPGTLKVIEKTAFDELMEIMNEAAVLLNNVSGCECGLETCESFCAGRLQDKFHKYKKQQGVGE